MTYIREIDEVSPEEDEASRSSLALAPWVAEQAAPLKAAHRAARRRETEELVQTKVSRWRRLRKFERGGHHRVYRSAARVAQ
jgi:hypothetical protein